MYQHLEVRRTPRKGHGVFALKSFRSGETIEVCPVLCLAAERDYRARGGLGTFVYAWKGRQDALLLGYGSLYNHSYTPNARYVRNYRRKTVRFVAYRHIKRGEEVTINYNNFPNSRRSVKAFLKRVY